MWVPYDTIQNALTKISGINDACRERWEGNGTTNYANPVERGGIFYVQILNGYESNFTEEEVNSSLETLPE